MHDNTYESDKNHKNSPSLDEIHQPVLETEALDEMVHNQVQ